MEISLKQRLVGAAVIVALAVIIIPILLDGSGNDGVRGIPPAPQQTTAPDQGTIGEHAIPLPPDQSQATVVTDSTSPPTPSGQAPATASPPAPQPVSPAKSQASAPSPAQAPAQAKDTRQNAGDGRGAQGSQDLGGAGRQLR
jgi:DedD protein